MRFRLLALLLAVGAAAGAGQPGSGTAPVVPADGSVPAPARVDRAAVPRLPRSYPVLSPCQSPLAEDGRAVSRAVRGRVPGWASLRGGYPRPRGLPPGYSPQLGVRVGPSHLVVFASQPLNAGARCEEALGDGAIIVGTSPTWSGQRAGEHPSPGLDTLAPELGHGIVDPFDPEVDAPSDLSGFLRTYVDGTVVVIQANLPTDGLVELLRAFL